MEAKAKNRVGGPGLLLAIDIGTTELKAAVVSSRGGKCLAHGAKRLSVNHPEQGAREQDPASVVRALRVVTRALQSELGRDWNRIEGIGLAAQGGSAILADRETGAAHTSMQLWNDMRPMVRLPELAGAKPEAYWKRLSGLAGPGAGLARLLWLRERYPREFSGATIYVGAGEYMYFRLTGTWRQDAGNALQIGCYSIQRRKLEGEPLALAGVPLSFVAPLRDGHEMHGLSAGGARLLGLPEGLPVAGPYIDHEAGYLSAAAMGGRPLQCSLGTAWVGNFVSPGRPRQSSGVDLVLPSPVDAGNLILRVLFAGNASWEWALRTFVSPNLQTALKRAEAIFRDRLLPPDGLMAYPGLTQPHPDLTGIAGNGCYAGINAVTTGEDMVRAMAAGLVVEFARLFEGLPAGAADRVVLAGGASRGWCFRAMLSAFFHPLPVYACCLDEPAGLRGSLYAFSKRAAMGSQVRVRRPLSRVVAQVKQYDAFVNQSRGRC